jgi:hypothetical protein
MPFSLSYYPHIYNDDWILDGIFACFPRAIQAAGAALATGDMNQAKTLLNRMMAARDRMITLGIWPAFSRAMNLLGFSGNFAPDYEPALDPGEWGVPVYYGDQPAHGWGVYHLVKYDKKRGPFMAKLVMDRRAVDNKYLHRDFFISTDTGLRYLGSRYGDAAA